MNRIVYIEVFTTVNNSYGSMSWIRFRRESGNHKHETHQIDLVRRADQINKVLTENCTISGATVGPWGIMSIVYKPKPTGKVIRAHPENSLEGERNYIRSLYELACTMSNTKPIGAAMLYHKTRQLEEAWYQRFHDSLDEEESIMPVSFYRDVVPLIESRASAAARGKQGSDLPASYYVCPVCGRQNDFTLWVSAHWDTRVEHNCFCGAKNYLKQGVLVD